MVAFKAGGCSNLYIPLIFLASFFICSELCDKRILNGIMELIYKTVIVLGVIVSRDSGYAHGFHEN